MTSAIAVCTLLACTGNASAATQIGAVFAPSAPSDVDQTLLQSTSPAAQYAAPFSGVITSWSHQAAAGSQQLKLKVARRVAGDIFTIVGESAQQTITPNATNTFGTRIPVLAGDVIGVHAAMSAPIAKLAAGYAIHGMEGDPPPGSTSAFNAVAASLQLDVAASLEPDCDSDGFGDETQDADTVSCNPDTTIIKHPKDKTKKKRATFVFTSSEPGAAFECRLDGGTFAPCTSPHTVRVKKGKHFFEVRATAAGHTDASPATDDWKVKKKKKKKKKT